VEVQQQSAVQHVEFLAVPFAAPVKSCRIVPYAAVRAFNKVRLALRGAAHEQRRLTDAGIVHAHLVAECTSTLAASVLLNALVTWVVLLALFSPWSGSIVLWRVLFCQYEMSSPF